MDGYLKLAKILGPIIIIALLFAWGKVGHNRAKAWEEKTRNLVAIVAEVSGTPKLKIKDSPAAVRKIGADRDRYFDQRNKARDSLQDQTDRVIDLGNETKRLREQADRLHEQVRKLRLQRDGWIRKAEAAATRTQRRSFEEEAAECEAAMDALRAANF